MRLLFLIIFSFITVVTVAKPAAAACTDEKIESYNPHLKSFSTIESEDLHKVGDHSKENHHTSHSCHLGHCSFILTTNLVPAKNYESNVIKFKETSLSLSNFQTQLFRPPIA